MVVVLTEVEPITHLPFTRVNPNFLEQVLHETPPSLKVKGYVPGGQVVVQFPSLAMTELPQLEQSFPGNTPKAI